MSQYKSDLGTEQTSFCVFRVKEYLSCKGSEIFASVEMRNITDFSHKLRPEGFTHTVHRHIISKKAVATISTIR